MELASFALILGDENLFPGILYKERKYPSGVLTIYLRMGYPWL